MNFLTLCTPKMFLKNMASRSFEYDRQGKQGSTHCLLKMVYVRSSEVCSKYVEDLLGAFCEQVWSM